MSDNKTSKSRYISHPALSLHLETTPVHLFEIRLMILKRALIMKLYSRATVTDASASIVIKEPYFLDNYSLRLSNFLEF